MSALPDTLREQLTNAMVIGGTNQLAAALDQVRAVSPELADALAVYIQDFNYTPVLEALDQVASTS